MSQKKPSFSTSGDSVKIIRISREKGPGSLPPPNTKRWVVRRKAQVVAAVHDGSITFEQACQRYNLSDEEFRAWMMLYDNHGVRGLRATRMQEYRPPSERHSLETAEAMAE